MSKDFEEEMRLLAAQRPQINIGKAIAYVEALVRGEEPPALDPIPTGVYQSPISGSVTHHFSEADLGFAYSNAKALGQWAATRDEIMKNHPDNGSVNYGKIQAIKELRALTYCSLKQAKEAIETFWPKWDYTTNTYTKAL